MNALAKAILSFCRVTRNTERLALGPNSGCKISTRYCTWHTPINPPREDRVRASSRQGIHSALTSLAFKWFVGLAYSSKLAGRRRSVFKGTERQLGLNSAFSCFFFRAALA